MLKAARKLKAKKAAGIDGLPAEFWKTVCTKDSPAAQWLLEFFNLVWQGKAVPDEWHYSRATAKRTGQEDTRLSSNSKGGYTNEAHFRTFLGKKE